MSIVKSLFEIPIFAKTVRKLYEKDKFTEEEYQYILECVILLLKEYDVTGKRELFELGYNLVLRYSLLSRDYQPLYDVACNYGFYPIVRYIAQADLLPVYSIQNEIIDYKVSEKYSNDGYVETYEQNKTRLNIINSKKNNIAFVAPTSSGKSSLIIQHLSKNERIKRAVVLVPTKSLISQSYMDLRKGCKNCKIISHEGMYFGEDKFIGALTQERLLRLLENNIDLSIDCVYVDEAHNIFSNDNRNVLLARSLRICKERNPNIQIIFLSPFINNIENLSLENINQIDEQRITYNIKEPNIFVRRKDGETGVYNRFLGELYYKNNKEESFDYIEKNCKNKNFIFINSPRKIEAFAEDFFNRTEEIVADYSITELQKLLADNIHPDFKVIKYLNHGIIYLHAKMPDQIKEYLEYQFKVNDKIKYLIANSVIMEGINLPIDCLFICNVWRMKNSAILNLIGRVNRLNMIFDSNEGNLDKLIPAIHFVDVPNYTDKKLKYENLVKKIYEKSMDEVRNPLLTNYSLYDLDKNKREKEQKKNSIILEHEKIYNSNSTESVEQFRKKLVVSGMNQFVDLSRQNVESIIKNIDNCNFEADVIDIVSYVFTNDVIVIDDDFKRLGNASAIKYYKFFMSELRNGSFSALLTSQLNYQIARAQEDNEPYMFVGDGYGEEQGWYDGIKRGKKVYIDIRKKTSAQLINLIIVKTKLEQEFLGFRYNRAVNFLHDNGYINDEKYNMEIYGTNDENKIHLLNLGISNSLLGLLESNNQLSNLSFDNHGNMIANEALKKFRDSQNKYIQYEMNKHILFVS